MSKTSPVADSRRGWFLLACDAFLFAGALFLAAMAALEAIVWGLGRAPSPWLEIINQLVLLLVVFGGALIALRLHDVRLHGLDWLVLVLGAIVGGVAVAAAVFALFGLFSFIPMPRTEVEGPWLLVAFVAVVIVAMLFFPVRDAVRTLVAGRNRGLAWARIIALVVLLIGIAASFAIGGETAEAGAFMVPFGVGAACAAVAAALFQERRR